MNQISLSRGLVGPGYLAHRRAAYNASIDSLVAGPKGRKTLLVQQKLSQMKSKGPTAVKALTTRDREENEDNVVSEEEDDERMYDGGLEATEVRTVEREAMDQFDEEGVSYPTQRSIVVLAHFS